MQIEKDLVSVNIYDSVNVNDNDYSLLFFSYRRTILNFFILSAYEN